ncbi:MAG: CopG family transcriptional regulator [Chloroflexi bacterium]|nr:CopG family transcriptional regulator [Betaproteobacteria bacterium]MBI4213000.1 CopG family transcriptional regulator [Chloroflexota bacterium]
MSYHDDMTRTTISLPDALLKGLKVLAAERGTSMAALVREALEEKVGEARPRPKSIGIAASGHVDTARLAGEIHPEPRSWR